MVIFFHGSLLAAPAMRIFNIAAFLKALERVSSTQSQLHSKERNCLTQEQVEKLIKVVMNRCIKSGQRKQRRSKTMRTWAVGQNEDETDFF